MTDIHQPTKKQVRDWMATRAKEHKPLPTQSELRRQLGMDLIESARNKQRKI